MPEGVRLSSELSGWTKLAIANAVVLFGRMEQEIIEITWILLDADLKIKLKQARNPATDNFLFALEKVQEQAEGLKFEALEKAFKDLAEERNLMVHGSWHMADEKPWVVWHKFLKDDDSVIGEYFERWRFDRFMTKAQHVMDMLRTFHNMLEENTGKKTSAIPHSK